MNDDRTPEEIEEHYRNILERTRLTRLMCEGTSPVIGTQICDDAENLIKENKELRAEVGEAGEGITQWWFYSYITYGPPNGRVMNGEVVCDAHPFIAVRDLEKMEAWPAFSAVIISFQKITLAERNLFKSKSDPARGAGA